jgi:hypothetical protein
MKMRDRAKYEAKQFVAIVQGRWNKLAVFETGDPDYYLFVVLDPQGNMTSIHIPTPKKDLRPEVARALKAGYGNANIREG